MFPFLPRKPMLGGKLVKKRKAEAEAAAAAAAAAASVVADSEGAVPPAVAAKANDTGETDKKRRAKAPAPKKPSPLDDLREGGPVERAIRSDLGNLRKLFDEDCQRRRLSMADASTSTRGTVEDTILHHDKAGSWYLLFKSAYRRGKFGIMHTRCMPNRIDRAEFAQIIYAACLTLFEDSMHGIDVDVGDESLHANLMTDAAFALFALYTLYETCPLPEFPSIVKTSNATESTGGIFSQQEIDVLTTLPLGLTAAGEQSRVIYRQAYKSPIRIGHADYARILKLQELCLECKSKCEYRRAERVVKTASDCMVDCGSIEDDDDKDDSPSPAETYPWVCQCGIADDCLEIIHRLQSKDCFDFCEYSGPCSVEGLVGSAKYFDKVVEPSNKKARDYDVASSVATSDLLREGHGAALSKDVATALGIDNLGKLYSNYHAALNKMHSIHSGNGNQSNQAHQIEETLRPVLRRRRRWSARNGGDNDAKPDSTARLEEILDKVQSGKVSADDALVILESSDDDEMGDGDAEPAKRSIWDQAGTAFGDEPLPIAAEREDREARSERSQVRFNLPSNFSPSLQRGIQDALASVEAVSAGQQFPPKEGVPITVGGGDAQSYMPMGMFDLEDIDLEPNIDEDVDHDVESVITQHTGHSVIPPTGAADALRDLLAFAKGGDSDDEAAGDGGDDNDNNNGDGNEDTRADANAPVSKEKTKRKSSRKKMRKQQETNDDDISMVSAPLTAGGGMNALGSLLSKVQPVQAKTKPCSKAISEGKKNKSAKAKRMPKTLSRRQQYTSNDEDDVSMVSAPLASGGGGDALGDLLTRATHHQEDDVSMVSAPLASGGGGNALGDLLSRAKKDEREVEN